MLIISAGQRHALGLNARYPLLLPVGSVLEFDDVLDDQRVAGAGVIADQRGEIVCGEVDPVTGTPQGIAGTNPAGPVAFLRPRTAGHRPNCPARALQGPGASFPRRLPATGGPAPDRSPAHASSGLGQATRRKERLGGHRQQQATGQRVTRLRTKCLVDIASSFSVRAPFDAGRGAGAACRNNRTGPRFRQPH